MSDTPSQPPGWYYAQGDPPGTQRYWDGTQWQGGPQAVPAAGGATAYGAASGGTPSPTGNRFIAFLIDWGISIGIYIVGIIIAAIIGDWFLIIMYLVALGWGIYNGLYLQGTTGQTIGKKQQNIRLVSLQTGQPVGIGMAFVRALFQGLLWVVCFIPYLVDCVMILTSDRNQRFSDGVLKFEVQTA